MTSDEIYLALRPNIIAVTGLATVIKAVQNAPSPAGSYASIHVQTSLRERGMAFIEQTLIDDGESIETDVKSQNEITCSIEFYRAGAKDYANKLLQFDKRSDVYWALYKLGICVMSTGPVMDLTALQSDQYEERARVDIYVRTEGSSIYEVNTIREVSTEVQVESSGVVQTATIRA